MKLAIIVAVGKNNVIGSGNTIPWYCPEDLKYFKRTTFDSPILMGRKTYDSLKIKPLPGRQNIVVTRSGVQLEGCDVVASIEEGVALAKAKYADKLFIIGGSDIYQQCLACADELYITEVDVDVEGDRYFSGVEESQWELVKQHIHYADADNPHHMTFKVFSRQR